MNKVGEREIITQNRIIKLFKNYLGYNYLGHWQDRNNNRNIEISLLKPFLQQQNLKEKLIERALRELDQATALGDGRSLYDANKEIYRLLRYGIKVKAGAGTKNQTIWLIDWTNPERNHFAIAEEVTIKGKSTKRPDIVIYVNGIAIGIIELKRSIVFVSEGIRQNLLNQRKEVIRPFFTTMQLVMAGNDTQGLRYGTTETPEKYYMEWKEVGGIGRYKLDHHLSLLCNKPRLLELMHDFIVFDAGIKKICRHNQYFGTKAAQKYIRRRQGGIIWHTQGSGKSLTMVWLTKWIREHVKNSRVLIITDRTELDEQIENIYRGVDEDIYRTKSGEDLVHTLNGSDQWLICSLIHKFGGSATGELLDSDIDTFMVDIEKNIDSNFTAKDDIYVFIDECHRTQSGKLHKAMKKILPNALLIGFTGTPLLKKDKKTTLETFGPYIHAYKFDEAVSDGVVVDLCYEARHIDQNVTAKDKIDLWFEAKTRGLNDYARAQLKKKWSTMQKILSSQSYLEKIVADILLDMETRDRLANGRGNAMLVSSSIYEACKFYELFEKTTLFGKCALITSYKPALKSIKNEESGESYTEKLRQYNIYRKMLSDFFDEPAETAVSRLTEFEKRVKEKFVKEPGQMRLLIVVDKLLTGFDAPPATYLYIGKTMRNHGLFQAVCRVNRLDGEDKEYGYIIDYKDSFESLEKSIKNYTGGAFDQYDKNDVTGLLQDRLVKAKERFEETRETIKALCEKVRAPQDTVAYIHYFCAKDTSDKHALGDNAARRLALYKATTAFIRAYAALANDMIEVGYTIEEIEVIKAEVDHFEKVRKTVKMASGDYIDLKVYEPAMRHLIDSYIRAEDSEKISAFDNFNLIKLINLRGKAALDDLPKDIRNNTNAVAETIENNTRKVIIDEQPINPKYYEKMSSLLDALIKQRKEQAIEYKDYLKKIVELSSKVYQSGVDKTYPKTIDTPAKRALFDNLGKSAEFAIKIHEAVEKTKKDDFRGNMLKERELEIAIRGILESTEHNLENTEHNAKQILELIKNQSEY